MEIVCSIRSLEEILQGWGFGELRIKSMGGRQFLIEFKDQELFDFLLEQKWSYLLEVFTEVEPWSELIHLPEIITWVQAEGIPLHCWNKITFKRIDEIWGTLLAMGENANQSLDGEKVTLLISTNQRSNLDGVLELEAGKECYMQVECEKWWPTLLGQVKFNAYGVASKYGAGCGGILCTDPGPIRAMFLGPIENEGADSAELVVVKNALEAFTEAKWVGKDFTKAKPSRLGGNLFIITRYCFASGFLESFN
ncbi:hypothetical protein V6N13_088910 [Hibiscus sabdariffa]